MKDIFALLKELKAWLTGISKSTLATIVISMPILIYLGGTLYLSYKTEVKTIQDIKSELTLIRQWKESLDARTMTDQQIIEVIRGSNNQMMDLINEGNRELTTEISNQLRFIVKYQEANKQAVLDRIDDWEKEIRVRKPDSLTIKVSKK